MHSPIRLLGEIAPHDASNDATIGLLRTSGMKKLYQMILKMLRGGRYAIRLSFVEVVGKAGPSFHFVYFTVNYSC